MNINKQVSDDEPDVPEAEESAGDFSDSISGINKSKPGSPAVNFGKLKYMPSPNQALNKN